MRLHGLLHGPGRGDVLNFSSDFCPEFGADGHRGDIIMMEAAKSLAALDNRREVGQKDVGTAAESLLPHRMTGCDASRLWRSKTKCGNSGK